nr:MAG TPA: hypothetical protein [Crassvirales sp.]
MDISKTTGGVLIKLTNGGNVPNYGMMLCIKRTHHDAGN